MVCLHSDSCDNCLKKPFYFWIYLPGVYINTHNHICCLLVQRDRDVKIQHVGSLFTTTQYAIIVEAAIGSFGSDQFYHLIFWELSIYSRRMAREHSNVTVLICVSFFTLNWRTSNCDEIAQQCHKESFLQTTTFFLHCFKTTFLKKPWKWQTLTFKFLVVYRQSTELPHFIIIRTAQCEFSNMPNKECQYGMHLLVSKYKQFLGHMEIFINMLVWMWT